VTTEPTPIGAGALATSVPAVVKRLRAGESFTLTSRGEPLADIVPRADRATEEPGAAPETEQIFRARAQWMIRIGRTLSRAGYTTPDSVRAASDLDLLDIRNIGQTTVNTIRQMLDIGHEEHQ